MNSVLLQQRNPTGCWDVSTGTSLGGRKKPFSHSIQCLPGHFWNNFFSFGSHYTQKIWTGSREWSQRWTKTGSLPYEEKLGLFSLEEWAWGRSYHHPLSRGWLQRRWRLPFHKEPQGKDKGLLGYKLLVGTFHLGTRWKFFKIWRISPLESSPRKALDLLTLDIFKVQLDRVLGHPVLSVFFQRKFVADDPGGNFQPSIPWFYE